MNQLIRSQYNKSGYIYAASAAEVAAKSGFDRIARLGSNENPFPPSPQVIEAASAALTAINRYPDPSARPLCDAIRRQIADAPLVTSGSGMDGVIETVIRVLINPGDTVVISTPTFSMYELAARAASARVINVARREDFSVDTDAFITAAQDAKLAFLCSPNNPTGTVTPAADIEKILHAIPGVLFLDCAYVEFCDTDYLPLLSAENLIIGRTLSKVYGLAGLRIGYAFVPDWMSAPYAAAATPFTLNAVSQAAAVAALEAPQDRDRVVAHVGRWREMFAHEIPFPVNPGGANFVLINVAPMKSDEAVKRLAMQGVLVRSCASFPGLGDTCIRVSIGDTWENERFLAAVKKLC